MSDAADVFVTVSLYTTVESGSIVKELEAAVIVTLRAPVVVVNVPDMPVRPPASVPVTVYAVPTVKPVVKVMVARPFASVTLVVAENEPPAPVWLHATTLPGVGTELPLASASCAVIVTVAPTTGLLGLAITM
jgi:hypothetical protein